VPDAPRPTGALVLVVEDEPRIAEVLEAYLRRDGFGTARAGDGPAALRLHERIRPDLVLLDVMLPGLDGFEVLRRLRADAARPSTPVILLTARDEDVDKLVGLRMGADDYVVKPFSPPEVVARVQAVLRRVRAPGADPAAPAPLRLGPLEIDTSGTAARVHGVPLALTATEYRMLELLARAPRRTFSRAQLLAAALPDSPALDRVVDAHLGNLRRKLAAAGAPALVETVRGFGYRLRPPPGTPT
jgi:two-component system response regulator AdeR